VGSTSHRLDAPSLLEDPVHARQRRPVHPGAHAHSGAVELDLDGRLALGRGRSVPDDDAQKSRPHAAAAQQGSPSKEGGQPTTDDAQKPPPHAAAAQKPTTEARSQQSLGPPQRPPPTAR
jgi:hypothetical protein